MTTSSRRPGLPHRHRPPAQRQRGLLLRPLPGLRRRRRDGRRSGRRGRLKGGGRRVRPRTSPTPARAGPAGDDRGGQPRGSTSTPAPTGRWPGWGRRSPRRSSTRRPNSLRSATSATAAPTGCATASRAAHPRSLADQRLAQEEADRSPGRGPPAAPIITRALGLRARSRSTCRPSAPQAGDVYLLCSDGLTTMLGDERIAHVLPARLRWTRR